MRLGFILEFFMQLQVVFNPVHGLPKPFHRLPGVDDFLGKGLLLLVVIVVLVCFGLVLLVEITETTHYVLHPHPSTLRFLPMEAADGMQQPDVQGFVELDEALLAAIVDKIHHRVEAEWFSEAILSTAVANFD